MTVMFYNVHKEADRYLESEIVPEASLDELLYADDTVCITADYK